MEFLMRLKNLLAALGLATLTAGAQAATVTFQQAPAGYRDTLSLAVFSARAETAFLSQSTSLNTLTVDLATADYGLGSTIGIAQGLIRFGNLFGGQGVPTGAIIQRATLQFFTQGATGQTPDTVSLHRMTVDWNATTTWNSLVGGITPGSDALSTPDDAHSVPTSNSLTSFDVTASVRAWAAGTSSNFGWAILNSGSDGWDFATERHAMLDRHPLLTIEFLSAVAASPVPLPASMWLLSGALGMLLVSRRQGLRSPTMPTERTVMCGAPSGPITSISV